MSSPRALVLSLVAPLVFVITTGYSRPVHGQAGGLGPDPYRPFNSQYDSFIYPVAPGAGDVMPNEAALSREGLSRSNQFQDYLRSTGASFRSQRQLDPKAFRESQYQPNRTVDAESGFYEKQEFVNQAYFSYLREKDPKKRAELLREYQRARAKPAREFATTPARRRRGSGSAEDESASASASRIPSPPGRRAARSRGTSTSESRSALPAPPPHSGASTSRTDQGSSVPPAPPHSNTETAPSPSQVLEESMRRDSSLPSGYSGSSKPAAPRSSSPGPIPPPPSRGGAFSDPESH